MNHGHTVPLKTERLYLRPFTLDDAEAMFANWAGDDRVTEYLRWPSHSDAGVSRGIISEWIGLYDAGNYYNWAIEYRGEAIGSIGVVNLDTANENAEIGYCLGFRWWGKGIMSEALWAVSGYLFDEVGCHRLCLHYDAGNVASGQVMRKCGYIHEGVLREGVKRRGGEFADLVLYSLLAHEWRAN